MIRSESIRDVNHVKEILDNLKIENKYIDAVGYKEGSCEYEESCYNIHMQLCEIEEFLVGKESCIEENMKNAQLRIFSYWKYIKEEINFEVLLSEIKKYSK